MKHKIIKILTGILISGGIIVVDAVAKYLL
ncbi:hypothetical protein C5L33_001518 [Lactobacillus pasteurii]|nr:hypothetical protein C5L33_001518 [Lactobacillus pasteurii]